MKALKFNGTTYDTLTGDFLYIFEDSNPMHCAGHLHIEELRSILKMMETEIEIQSQTDTDTDLMENQADIDLEEAYS